MGGTTPPTSLLGAVFTYVFSKKMLNLKRERPPIGVEMGLSALWASRPKNFGAATLGRVEPDMGRVAGWVRSLYAPPLLFLAKHHCSSDYIQNNLLTTSH